MVDKSLTYKIVDDDRGGDYEKSMTKEKTLAYGTRYVILDCSA